MEQVDTKPSTRLAGFVSDIQILTILKFFQLVLAEDFTHQLCHFLGRQLTVLDGFEHTMQTNHRRHADRQMNIGTTLLPPQFQKCVNACH